MKKFTTVNEYLQQVPPTVRAKLKILRTTIKKAVPGAQEVISYGMPAYKFHGMLVYFAAFKEHYSIFVPRVLHLFKEELASYKTSKATLQLRYEKPVPVRLVTKLVKCAAKLNLEKAELKKK